MFGTIISVCALLLFNALCLLVYLPSMLTEGMYSYLSIIMGLSLLIFAIGYITSKILIKNKQFLILTDSPSLINTLKDKHYSIAIIVATIILILLKIVAPLINSTLVYALAYCSLFISFGIWLSKKNCTNFAPIFFSFSTILLSSLIAFFAFVYDSSAISQFGPERFLFALRDFVGDTSIFLLAAAFSWSSWKIALSIRATPHASA